jgi:hypothetical protein
MMSGGTEIGGMTRDYRAGEVALGARMFVLSFSTSHPQRILTLRDTSVATATETCTAVGTVR